MQSRKSTGASSTAFDILINESDGRYPRTAGNRHLRGLVAFDYARMKAGLSDADFGCKYVETADVQAGIKDPSGLTNLWRSGKSTPTRKKLIPAASDIDGVLDLHDEPVFELLEDRPISCERIDELVEPYRELKFDNLFQENYWSWIASNEKVGVTTFVPKEWREVAYDTESPFDGVPLTNSRDFKHWRNIAGFTVVLAHMRKAEVWGHSREHVRWATELYRCLPTLGMFPWFRRHQQLLFSCIQRIHMRDHLSFCIVKVNHVFLRWLASSEVQSTITTYEQSVDLWRTFDDQGLDVVRLDYPKCPPIVRDPFTRERSRNYFERILKLPTLVEKGVAVTSAPMKM